jgi:hypothetical protein
VTWNLLVHRDQRDEFPPERVTDLMAMLVDVHAEDMASCARVQAGLESGLIDRFRLTALEAPIADLHRWIIAKYASVS